MCRVTSDQLMVHQGPCTSCLWRAISCVKRMLILCVNSFPWEMFLVMVNQPTALHLQLLHQSFATIMEDCSEHPSACFLHILYLALGHCLRAALRKAQASKHSLEILQIYVSAFGRETVWGLTGEGTSWSSRLLLELTLQALTVSLRSPACLGI